MDYITKPSITRLARTAGVKSLSDDSFATIQNILEEVVSNTMKKTLVVNSEHNTKTLMLDDFYDAMKLEGISVAKSNDLSKNNCIK